MMTDSMAKVQTTIADLIQDPNAEDPADALVRVERSKAIADAINRACAQLPHRQRQVFTAIHEHEMTYAEAGEKLDISRETVKVQLLAARKRLVKLLTPVYKEWLLS